MKKKTVTKKKDKKPAKEKAPVKSEIDTLLTTMKPAHVRFTFLYMGGEDGRGFNNATISYLIAHGVETDTRKQSDGKYTKEYLHAKSEGYRLATNADIQRLRHLLLLEAGFTSDSIKKRYAEMAYQNKNLPIALTATDRLAKIQGVVKDDGLKLNVPEIERLTDVMQKLLTPKS